MLGFRSWFIVGIKQERPNAVGSHCVFHQEALASRTQSAAVKDKFAIIIRAVHVVKTSAVNQYSIVRKAVRDIDSNPCRKLYFMWKGLLARVAESEVFVWSRIPNNTRSRSRIFLSDSDSGSPIGSFFTSCWNGTISSISFETFIETENSCYVPRFPLSVATKLLTSKLHSRCVKESASENLERSDILPPTPQPWCWQRGIQGMSGMAHVMGATLTGAQKLLGKK